ncbi:MAG: class I SAM-dependent methyltransferase [Patescibacteria group bacterium]|jgi:hypothetical protein
MESQNNDHCVRDAGKKTSYANNFNKYCDPNRWASYWHQINSVLGCRAEKVLEIGIGDRVLANYLKSNTSIDYHSVDVSPDLCPDIVNSIDDLKDIEDNFFDVVCAFEVLEHLPYEKFNKALGELYRVSSRHVILSLPHWGRHFSFDFRLPFIKRIRWQIKLQIFGKKHKFDGHHFWELGKRGYSLKRVKSELVKAGFKIEKDYIAFESPYHHFFILKK